MSLQYAPNCPKLSIWTDSYGHTEPCGCHKLYFLSSIVCHPTILPTFPDITWVGVMGVRVGLGVVGLGEGVVGIGGRGDWGMGRGWWRSGGVGVVGV